MARRYPKQYHDDSNFVQRGQHQYIGNGRDEKSLTLGRPPRSSRTNLFQQNVPEKAPPSIPTRSTSVRANLRERQISTSEEESKPHLFGGRHDQDIGTLAERKQRILQSFPNATLKPTHPKVDQNLKQKFPVNVPESQLKQQPTTKPKPHRQLPSSVNHNVNERAHSHSNNTGPPIIPRRSKPHIPQDGSSSSESGSSGDGRFIRKVKKAVPIPLSEVSKISLQHTETQSQTPQALPRFHHNQNETKHYVAESEPTRENGHTTGSEGRKATIRRTPSMSSSSSLTIPDSNAISSKPYPQQASTSPNHGIVSRSRAMLQQNAETNSQPYVMPKTTERINSSSQQSSQEPIQLQTLLTTHLHHLPMCVEVREGLSCTNHSLSQNERLNLHFVKLCRVVVVQDMEKRYQYYVPINSSQKFGIVYDPTNDIKSFSGYMFPTAGDLMKAKPLPCVVLATSSFDGGSLEKSVEANELLFIRGVSKTTGLGRGRFLKVQTLDFTEKHLSPKCMGNFSTRPEAVQMHLSTATDHYISLPQKAILYPQSEIKHLLPSSLVLDAVMLERLTNTATVIATVQSTDGESVIEISADLNIQIEAVALHKTEQDLLYRASYDMHKYYTSQEPVLVCGKMSTEIQDKFYHNLIPNMEMKGVQLYLPNVTPLPHELKETLRTQSLSWGAPAQNSSNAISPMGSSSEEEEESSDEENVTTQEEPAIPEEEVEEVEDDDEEGLYETIDEVIDALPDEEAQKLKSTAAAGVSSVQSKITNMLKVVTAGRKSVPSASIPHTSKPPQPDTLSLESEQENYDNITYPSETNVQDRSLPDISSTSLTRSVSQHSAVSTLSSNKGSQKDDYEDFQFSGNDSGTIKKELPPPPSPLQLRAPHVIPDFSVKPTPSGQSYEQLYQLYTKLQDQVSLLSEDVMQLKTLVKEMSSSNHQRRTAYATDSPLASTTHSVEENKTFLESMDEHEVSLFA